MHPESTSDHKDLVVEVRRRGIFVATRAERAVALDDEDAAVREVDGPRVHRRRHRAEHSAVCRDHVVVTASLLGTLLYKGSPL